MLGDFEYVRARSISEAVRLLTEADGTAAVFSGGTDLLVEIRNGLRRPKLLVDVKRIEELARLETPAGEATTIGGAVPLNRIVEDRAIRDRIPGLAEAAFSIATYQLRNRATIGGNLCNASPAADGIPPLLAVDASLHVVGPDGERDVPLRGFCVGVKRTCLKRAEIVTEIRIPPLAPGTRTAFVKQQRIRGHDLAVANLAGALSPSDSSLRVAIGSCAPVPILLDPIETSGHTIEAIAAEAACAAANAISPISDVRASAEYRRAVVPVLARRLVTRLMDGSGGA